MSIDTDDITAVILAGGRGLRFEGQDKGLVKLNGKPMIEHILERLKPQIPAIIINANRNQERYKAYGLPVISDTLSNYQGPLAGIASALQSVQTQYILTLACDAPLLPLNYVAKMRKTLNDTQSQNAIVVAHDGKTLQTVHALIPVLLLDSLQTYLTQGHRKVESWYADHNMQRADFSENAEAFENINTQTQHLKIEQASS